MEIRYFTWWNNPVHFTLESRVLIVSHLLADSLTLGGDVGLHLLLDEKMRKLSLDEKFNYLYGRSLIDLSDKENIEINEGLELYYRKRKAYTTLTAANRTAFVTFKKLESTILGMCNSYLDHDNDMLKKTAFPILRQMMEFNPIATKLDFLAQTAAYNKHLNPVKMAKEILEFIFTPNANGKTPVFVWETLALLKTLGKRDEANRKNGSWTFDPPETIEEYYQLYDSKANFFENWYNMVLEIPHISHLDGVEMLTLKKEMQVSLSEFNAVADDWLQCRAQHKPTKEWLAQTHFDFKRASEKLTNEFKAHRLCQLPPMTTIEKQEYYTLLFFNISLVSLWDDFESQYMLPTAVIAELRKITANNSAYPSTMSVLGIMANNDGIATMMKDVDPDDSQVVITKKKSIDFD